MYKAGDGNTPTGLKRGDVWLPEVGDNKGSTSDWRGASPLCAAARAKIFDGVIGMRVQTTSNGVFFNLAVPRIRVKFGKPRPECGKFRLGEFEYSRLDLFYDAHYVQLTPHQGACTTFSLQLLRQISLAYARGSARGTLP